MKTIQSLKRLLPSICAVEGCWNRENLEQVELKRFDPIDHNPLTYSLCDKHQEWATERNQVAELFHEELREARKEIGQANKAIIQEYAMPQDGKLREDILMGNPDEDFIHLNDMFEESKQITMKPPLVDKLNDSTDSVQIEPDDVDIDSPDGESA